MPDTGAPWNIPYVAGTDLVRDWPTDSQELAEAIADALDDAAAAGIGSNAVSTLKTDIFTTTSSSFTDVTGLAATITPTSATAKVLVTCSFALSHSTSFTAQAEAQLVRDSTAIAIGTDAGSTVKVTAWHQDDNRALPVYTVTVLDSPATTSATTYKLQIKTGSGTAVINSRGNDQPYLNVVSSITAIEVAA